MYSLHFYGQMLADRVRIDAYAAALRQAVKPDSIVLDLGCGPGLFALLACKLGARRVYAVEPDNVINIARAAAVANGFAERIEFFQSLSTEITLREPATIMISDLRGVLPWFQQHIPAIIDARNRLLTKDAVLIPRRDLLWAALVEATDEYEKIVGPWEKNQFELDLSAGTARITNTWRKTHLRAEELLSEPVCWAALHYYKVSSPDVSAEISWRAARSGTAHGVAVWFDADLAEGIGFSNRPGATELIYGTGFFPFPRPVDVREGERVEVKLRADLVKDDYVWTWETDFADQKIGFRQSTFYGVALSPEQLRKNYA
ncbi:MAG TPA: 50S ribosomal protein L11 methyltransferase [Pyrinomonadaceae bacterium]|nr:50S ribosomal protein L11 methyltransferase [Pyrinomonadaceae bacterium]